MTSPDGPRSNCPISCALEILGDRWTLLVVRDLIFLGKRRYREFLESPEGIATNVLADRLKRLEAGGIVVKVPDPASRRSHLYLLTDKGLDLLPVLIELAQWGAKHEPETAIPEALADRIQHDREGFMAELRAQLRP